MKKKLLALGLAVMTVAMSLVGCSEKAVTWTVTCPWAPSGVAAMVSQKAASLSNTYSDKIILVADAVKDRTSGDFLLPEIKNTVQ